jgi:hypothetical protein
MERANDTDLYGGATIPALGLRKDCSRINARIYFGFGSSIACSSIGYIWGLTCTKVATANDVPAAFEWTLSCYEGKASCLSCLTDSPAANPAATQSSSTFLDAVKASGTKPSWDTGSRPGGGKCGADCDCGHCYFCESGTCRYGGEGPYACYRGCQ